MWNYDTIKEVAKELRKAGTPCRVTDLIALAPQNDPFYVGSPAQVEAAQWFANLWQQFSYGHGVHLRRVHYQTVSQVEPMELPTTLTWKEKDAKGKPTGKILETDTYINVERCWQFLVSAGKWARYLKLVPVDHFVDRRNPEAIVNAEWSNPGGYNYKDPTPRYEVKDGGDWYYRDLPNLPSLPHLPYGIPDLPYFSTSGYGGLQQNYHIEVWAEKATMNDVLLPLCRQYGVNLVTGLGELSITAARNFIKRVSQAQRPGRVLYISDFDPAGLGMPISVAVKIQFFQQEQGFDNLDIRLEPIVLTADQIKEYDLPRVPVKDTDLRKAGFEAAHGEGQVELDALEALHPGHLAQIVKAAILNYYDPDLDDRANSQYWKLDGALDDEHDTILTWFSDDLKALRGDYAELVADFDKTREQFDELVSQFQPEVDAYSERLEAIKERGEELYSKLRERLEETDVDVDDYPLPEPDLPLESNGLLYDSNRSYLDQLPYYDAHRQGNGR